MLVIYRYRNEKRINIVNYLYILALCCGYLVVGELSSIIDLFQSLIASDSCVCFLYLEVICEDRGYNSLVYAFLSIT